MNDDDLDEYGDDEDPAVSALVGVYKSAQEAMKSELDRLRKENAALKEACETFVA